MRKRFQPRFVMVGLVIGGALTSAPTFAATPDANRFVVLGMSPPVTAPPNVRTLVVGLPTNCVRSVRPVTEDSRKFSLAPSPDRQERPSGLPSTASTSAAPAATGQRWGRTILELFYVNMAGHAVRMIQKPTRAELKGPFFREWFQSAKPIFAHPHWDDDGPFSINYIGHPMTGAAYGMIQRQNNGHAKDAELGSAAYWRNVPKAIGVSALASLNYEIGPLSEASLGNIGLQPVKQGYIDLVVTPLLGTAWMIGQDAFDKYVMRRLETKVGNNQLRAIIRCFADIPRSVANMTSRKAPWYRADRPLASRQAGQPPGR
jgi:hypothetical protein